MYSIKYVFSQITSFLDRSKFNRLVAKYNGDSYVKSFTCWNQLLVLMFGQLCQRKSLRDLSMAIGAHRDKLYHLGFGKSVTLSNLSKANNSRDYRIFEDYAYFMVAQAQKKLNADVFKLGGKVYAFDSTTIDLCLSVYEWAKFRRTKAGIKVHTLFDLETHIPEFFHITSANVHDSKAMDKIDYQKDAFYVFDRGYNDFYQLNNINSLGSYFVVRGKQNLNYRVIRWKRRMKKNILSDSIVKLDGYMSSRKYPNAFRRIVYYDEEQDREFTFLTNALSLEAQQVADLYKSRWQIELFFKWMKQHLNIQRFWGTTENAMRIQIYSAIITYCLAAIIHHDMKLKCSVYEMLQVLSMSLIDNSNIRDLLDPPNDNIVNELDGSSEPNLFNY